jgi:hypothetical protein
MGTTNASGQASFSYVGTTAGTDAIHAFADSNGNGTQDPGEPFDNATKIWTPLCDQGQADEGNGQNNDGQFSFNECNTSQAATFQNTTKTISFRAVTGAHTPPTFDARSPIATTTGRGLLNGREVTYTLVATDLGIGPGTDRFSLTLSDSSGVVYVTNGTLTSGNIVVRR